MARVRFPAGTRDFSLLHRGKEEGCESDHSPPSSAKVKNGGDILPLPHTFSCHGA
jgi:hypothetical protein